MICIDKFDEPCIYNRKLNFPWGRLCRQSIEYECCYFLPARRRTASPRAPHALLPFLRSHRCRGENDVRLRHNFLRADDKRTSRTLSGSFIITLCNFFTRSVKMQKIPCLLLRKNLLDFLSKLTLFILKSDFEQKSTGVITSKILLFYYFSKKKSTSATLSQIFIFHNFLQKSIGISTFFTGPETNWKTSLQYTQEKT